MDNVALALNVFKRIENDSILRALPTIHGSLKVSSRAGATITRADACIELVSETVHQGTVGLTDARRIISLLIGKCAPFGSGVDDLVPDNHTTVAANKITAGELLD